jgi:hypothetical protein
MPASIPPAGVRSSTVRPDSRNHRTVSISTKSIISTVVIISKYLWLLPQPILHKSARLAEQPWRPVLAAGRSRGTADPSCRLDCELVPGPEPASGSRTISNADRLAVTLHDDHPLRVATAHRYTRRDERPWCPASGCKEWHCAAPTSTDSGQRRFSTQISTQTGTAAELICRIAWSQPSDGMTDRSLLLAFQAITPPRGWSPRRERVRLQARHPVRGRAAGWGHDGFHQA